MSAARHHLKELTGARFVAAAAVFIAHTEEIHPLPSWLDFFGDRGGRAAVCFFFVLSGFVLAYTYRSRLAKEGIGSFYAARVARIYPVHLMTLLLATPIAFLTMIRNPNFAAWSGASVGTTLHFVESWFATLGLVHIYVLHPLFVLFWDEPNWSIACEAGFYFAFPLVFPWLLRLATSRLRIFLLMGAFVVVQVVGVEICLLVTKHYWFSNHHFLMEGIAYHLPFFRIWEFLIGCCAGILFTDFPFGSAARAIYRNGGLAMGCVVAAGIMWASVHGVRGTPYHSWFDLYTLPFALIIFCLASGPTFVSPLLASRLMVLLGEASFSFYLLHALVLELASCVYPPVLGHDDHVPGWVLVVAFVVTVVASVLSLKLVELPCRLWVRDIFRKLAHRGRSHRPVDMLADDVVSMRV